MSRRNQEHDKNVKMAKLPVQARGISYSDLIEELASLEYILEGISIEKARIDAGYSMDPGTVTLLIDIAKVAIPALITGIATILSTRPRKRPIEISIEIVTGEIHTMRVSSDSKDKILLEPDPSSIEGSIDSIARLHIEV